MMLRALKMFDYVGRRIYPDDVFEPASDNDAHVLTAARMAEPIDDDGPRPKKKRNTYKHRKMQAED